MLQAIETTAHAVLTPAAVRGTILTVAGARADGSKSNFQAKARIDSAGEIDYYRHGGILQLVLRRLMKGEDGTGV